MPTVNAPVHTPGLWILALDTSSERLGVALSDGERTAEIAWQAGRQQSAVLLDAVEVLLKRVGIAVAELAAVAVAVGPGPFNGLRAGLGTAKGLALGANLPLIGVDTLAATVLPVLAPGRTAVGVVAAGRGRVVRRAFRAPDPDETPGYPVAVGEAANGSVEDLVAHLGSIAGPLTLIGEVSDDQLRPYEDALAGLDLWLPPAGPRDRRPASVAAVARARWVRGDIDDPATLDAVYLHSAARPAHAPG
ncbi:MAG TPA: tRNA (adenosine(37)-N6)-threonylcarbamoyltransferase complex dimerization subunit type 1 TsaB [Thermomicrobiales bacterium]|nr:tRNA (adenosine(37)-N6)-threonylcarbamoyltransferase complex dimerization subunit type 1 TsaB [Thermomicrobiales bacterium]